MVQLQSPHHYTLIWSALLHKQGDLLEQVQSGLHPLPGRHLHSGPETLTAKALPEALSVVEVTNIQSWKDQSG